MSGIATLCSISNRWVDSAKRQETKERRLREALALLADGKKFGLK